MKETRGREGQTRMGTHRDGWRLPGAPRRRLMERGSANNREGGRGERSTK